MKLAIVVLIGFSITASPLPAEWMGLIGERPDVVGGVDQERLQGQPLAELNLLDRIALGEVLARRYLYVEEGGTNFYLLEIADGWQPQFQEALRRRIGGREVIELHEQRWVVALDAKTVFMGEPTALGGVLQRLRRPVPPIEAEQLQQAGGRADAWYFVRKPAKEWESLELEHLGRFVKDVSNMRVEFSTGGAIRARIEVEASSPMVAATLAAMGKLAPVLVQMQGRGILSLLLDHMERFESTSAGSHVVLTGEVADTHARALIAKVRAHGLY